jgi:non-heme chloroperoxidase
MTSVTTSDGVGLHVDDQGDGPVVVLVAGFNAPAASWAPQVESLLAAGRRVVAIDRRWHGRSERPAYGFRMARHGKDLHDVLSALDVRDAVLVGGSMGASAIWSYLDLFGTERTRAMVSVDQTPKMVNGDGWDHGFYGITHANSGVFFDGGIPDTGHGLSRERMMPGLQRMMDLFGPEGRTPPSPDLMPLLRDHAQQDWRDVVARLDVPVLMVAGRESQYWPCEHAAAAVAGNPQGRSVVIEDCGHPVNFDQPEAFDAALHSFLGDL